MCLAGRATATALFYPALPPDAVSLRGGLVVTVAKEKLGILSAHHWTCSRPGGRNAHSRRERACGPQGRRVLHGGGMAKRLDLKKGVGDLERGRRRLLKIKAT